ncbi:hypothetical protein LTR37_007596 [Vermiconidia calcicola]|uniref:Uncharacterized protein n=1 Tax=Vermiconidia calcicola TaxID=1690605 RepID=A0ACC3NDI2_9PEZI|nr:hypothetical protein LTR37_007596 [Vermiconidia calcicola]
MPPRVPLNTRAYASVLGEPYVCPSCLLKGSSSPASQQPLLTRRRDAKNHSTAAQGQLVSRRDAARGLRRVDTLSARRRYTPRYASNGSLASRSAINAPTSVPPAYRELHQRLLALQESASSYVDLARLQLATRSLESSDPVTRVAFLGLGSNGPLAARKLARVLLSDALGQEEAWEKEILDSLSDGRSLLLRYGDAEEAAQSNPLVKTMSIPSRFLDRHRLEIMITGLSTNQDTTTSREQSGLEDAILVPTLTTPNSSEGRVGFVRYPVHRAVLVAEGITGAVEYGRLPPKLTDSTLISAALSVLLRSSNSARSGEEAATGNALDIDLADHALSLFRADKANGARFCEEWQTSRIPALAEWIGGSKETAASNMNPAVQNLVSSVLSRTSNSINQAEEAANTAITTATVPETKRANLQTAISEWSAEAHRDLQINLDTAFSTSPSWRRTAWWRLFWRIDDVTVSASDILRRSWLTEAEQRLAYLSGRITEAGLANAENLRGSSPRLLDEGHQAEMQEYETHKAQTETVAELMQMPSLLTRMQQQSGVNAQFNPPWPQSINLSRQYMLHTLVPQLHRKAQALLVTALSTIGGSAALSAWFYVATSGSGLYESGAVVALGLVWSLRRLQKEWGVERDGFAELVREDARRVLAEVERYLRKVVNEDGRARVRVEDAQSWRVAREAVERCRSALESVRGEKSQE